MTTRTAEPGVATPLPRQPPLTRIHYVLIAIVAAGATLIAGIGFAGSYTAVRELAEAKGFGRFALVFPLGIDAGIVVLLALDLLLTWMRIPFPLLRQTAWLLTAATIAFNGAAAWPDPLGVGMHAVIPVLFVVTVEAARHAVGRIADITADRHMEGVRITRWLLAPFPTARLWRRMKLWEIRSYREAVQQEQHRLVYQVHLRSRYGRGWRRRADVQELLPLRLTHYGIPLAQTAPQVLQSIGFTPADQLDTPQTVTTAAVPTQATPASHSAAATSGRGPTSTAGENAGLGESGVQHSGVGEESRSDPGSGAADDRAPAVPPSGDRSAAGPVADAPVSPTHSAAPATYAEALDAYVSAYGTQPNARQYGRFLQETYGMADPATGGPLPEAQLRLILRELRRPEAGENTGAEAEAGPEGRGRQAGGGVAAPVAGPAGTVTGRSGAGAGASVMADGRPATTDTAIGHPPGEAAHAALGSSGATSQRAGSSSPQGDYGVITQPSATRAGGGGRGSADTSGGLAASGRSSSAGGDYGVITQPSATSVAGGGDRSSGGFTGTVSAGEYAAATARVLEPEEGPVLSAEQERFLAVAAWLEESEETATKLSGAEVARRLGVSPRTGQRLLKKAVQTREEQLRQNAGTRGRLRSVSPRD